MSRPHAVLACESDHSVPDALHATLINPAQRTNNIVLSFSNVSQLAVREAVG